MKAKVIYWGWIVSWLFLLGGIGTMENAELGSGKWLWGVLLCCVWFVFSLLLIDRQDECLEEADKLERWADELFMKINKWF